MLFARWRHHIRFGSDFPYAPLKAMLTKISKWSRIQDSFRITPKIESLVVFAIPDIPRKFQKDPSITFWVILLTHRQTNKQTNKVWQKHYLLGGGNYRTKHNNNTFIFLFLLLFCSRSIAFLRSSLFSFSNLSISFCSRIYICCKNRNSKYKCINTSITFVCLVHQT